MTFQKLFLLTNIYTHHWNANRRRHKSFEMICNMPNIKLQNLHLFEHLTTDLAQSLNFCKQSIAHRFNTNNKPVNHLTLRYSPKESHYSNKLSARPELFYFWSQSKNQFLKVLVLNYSKLCSVFIDL